MSDDFFGQNFSSGPPKQTTNLRPRGAAAARRPPPPPPGRRPIASSGASASMSNSVSSAPNSGSRSSSGAAPPPRPRPAARPAARPTAGARPTASSASRPTPTNTTATRTAPTMNRPVGSYYGSSNNNTSTPPVSASGRPGGNTNNYGTSTTTQSINATTSSNQNGGFDWGTPASAPVPASMPSNNQWAAPKPAPAAAPSNSNDWFASSTTTANTNNSLQSSQPLSTIPQPTRFGGGAAYGTSSSSLAHSTSNDSLKYNAADLEGAMDDDSAGQQQQQHSTFNPQQYANNTTGQQQPTAAGDFIDYDNEPPLLEELGIHTDNIIAKTKAVIIPSKRLGGHSHLSPETIVQDADLAGPIAFCLLLGGEMVLTGKLQFGYIYGFALFGCVSMTLVVNLMSLQPISIWTVSSILGYSLLPVNLLACVKIFVMNLINLQRLGRFLGLLTVLWSTTASTRLLELGCGLRDQRYLIAYPLALLYSAFVLITIF